MTNILLTQFGSHVYGTNTETSDTDYKSIFIPKAKDIILQRAPKTIVENSKVDKNSRNTSSDIDIERFALHQYLDLLMQGQTVAIDILFTPKQWYKEQPLEIWNIIRENKDKFLHKGTTAFVGYARQQASKYGIKGSRVKAMREILEMLKSLPIQNKLLLHKENINKWIVSQNSEYIKLTECRGPNGIPEPHLEVCNRKIPFRATVKYALEIFQQIFDEYGARALLAEKNDSVDWKALMHAVRVCNQAKELLSTAHVTFPRPEAMELLKIRKGELPYKQIAEMIENGLEELEQAKLVSTLRESPDREFAEKLIEEWFVGQVIVEYGLL